MVIAVVMSLTMTSMAATAQSVVESVKTSIAPDKRTAVFDVSVDDGAITGTVGTQEQYDALSQALGKAGVKTPLKVKVLENQVPASKKWALVCNSVATLRAKGSHSAECETQVVMGHPVKVLEVGESWTRVICADDYISWAPTSSLKFVDDNALAQWKNSDRYVVTAYSTRLTTEPGGDETVTDLVLSNILQVCDKSGGGWWLMQTPDGRKGYIDSKELMDIDQWASQDFDADLLEKTARRMMGSTYLWGGTSTKMTDCSGLMKVCYLANGIILQRDASQQALTGKKIAISQWRTGERGDLVFFGNEKTGKVTHVGMYLRDGSVIHCSGRVKINNLDTSAPDGLRGYGYISMSRINGMVGTKGITATCHHPWYF